LEAVPRERAREVAQHRDERLLVERQRAGKRRVLARAAERERRQAHDAGAARAQTLGDRVRDQRVGRERQVRSVLLGRAERQERRAAAGREQRLDVRPGQALERRRARRRERTRIGGLRRALRGRLVTVREIVAPDVVQRAVGAASGPARLIDLALRDPAQDERVEQRLVLEQRERARER